MSKQLELPFPPEYIEIPLSKTGTNAGKYVSIVSYEDRDLANFNWFADLTPTKSCYATRQVLSKGQLTTFRIHRIVMERKLGRKLAKGEVVDHIDGDGANNLRDNLRVATHQQNLANRGKQRDNTSGYKGVTQNKRSKQWMARIKFQGKCIHLGCYMTPKEAHEAYCRKADELYGEFANYGVSV